MSRARWALAGVMAVHLGLVAYFCPPSVVLGGEPFGGPDYQTHAVQARVLREAIEVSGRTWSYDPLQLAGWPTGIWFDADSKAHGLWTLALARLGVRFATAFNLFTVLFHLAAPLLVHAAARSLRLGARAAVIATALSSLLWFFDSLLHFFWLWGMISFAGASLLAVLTYAEFVRLVDDSRNVPKPGHPRYVALVALLPLTLLVHPLSFVFLVVPMVAHYAGAARRLPIAAHARTLGLALAGLGASLLWLWPSLRFATLLTGERQLGQAGPWHLLTDYFDLLESPLTTGAIEPKTLFRFLVLGAAVAALWRSRRAGDPLARPLGVAIGWGLVLAYAGSLLGPLRHTEPYRFIAPTMLLATLPAALLLDEALDRSWLRQLPAVGKASLALLALLLAPRVAQQIGYFVPLLQPSVARLPFPGGPPNGWLADAHGGWLTSPRHTAAPPEARELARWLAATADDTGRVLVQKWALAELLRGATDLPILGGFPDRRLPHGDADCFRSRDDPRRLGQEFSDYLDRYNVRYVVVTSHAPEVESRTDLLELRTRIGPHRVYQTRGRTSYVVAGEAAVTARTDRIEVTGAPSELVLKFHWLDTLRCQPGCLLEREPVPGDGAGFIRVRNAPPSFVIANEG